MHIQAHTHSRTHSHGHTDTHTHTHTRTQTHTHTHNTHTLSLSLTHTHTHTHTHVYTHMHTDLFLRTFQQPSNPFCCNRSTTSLFMISFLSRTVDFFFFFLSLWIYLWLAETSQQPISQTTWLKVTPHCNHYCG